LNQSYYNLTKLSLQNYFCTLKDDFRYFQSFLGDGWLFLNGFIYGSPLSKLTNLDMFEAFNLVVNVSVRNKGIYSLAKKN